MFNNLSLDLNKFHGFTSEIIDFASIRGSHPSNLTHYLTYFGAALGRYPYIQWRGDIYPALNSVIIGDTGSGKGESLELISKFFEFAGEWHSLAAPCLRASLTSGINTAIMVSDMLEKCEDGERRALNIDEECSSQLVCSNIRNNTLPGVMIKLIDGIAFDHPSKSGPIHIPSVHFGSAGHVTPQTITETLKDKDIMNGFANRRMFIGIPMPEYSYDEASYSNETLVEIRNQIADSLEKGSARQLVELADDAKERYRAFWIENKRRQRASNMRVSKLLMRSYQICLKVALIIALTNQEEKVSLESMEAAIALMDYSYDTINELFGDTAIETPETVVTSYLMQQTGFVSKTELMAALAKKNLERPVINKVLVSLANKEMLAVKQVTQNRGRRPTFYKLIEPNLDNS